MWFDEWKKSEKPIIVNNVDVKDYVSDILVLNKIAEERKQTIVEAREELQGLKNQRAIEAFLTPEANPFNIERWVTNRSVSQNPDKY